MMRKCALSAGATLLVLALGGFAFLWLGFMPTHADARPPAPEQWLATQAIDASMVRHAPRVDNPIPPTDNNLIDGMKLYTMNCSVCHGEFDGKPSTLAHALYPPPPQLILDPPDDPEWQLFYVIRTGVRYTGMPAWGAALSPDDMWKVTGLLSRLDRLPPGVQTYWKNAFGTTPSTAGGARREDR
jgi:mono/diheme cytochrome c family protein